MSVLGVTVCANTEYKIPVIYLHLLAIAKVQLLRKKVKRVKCRYNELWLVFSLVNNFHVTLCQEDF